MELRQVVIECNGIVQQFNLSSQMDQWNLQMILSSVFGLQNQQIVAVTDQNGNVFDLLGFTQGLANFSKKDRFTVMTTPQDQGDKLTLQVFSKDRGQSQQGKRQKPQVQNPRKENQENGVGNICRKSSAVRDSQQDDHQTENRLMSRSHSILQALPERVKYFEDFEFFVKTIQHENPNTFYLIWFFDFQEKMKEYNFMGNQALFQLFPQIEHYTGLYPSFRSRPFGKYDETICLSFFRGDQLLFERDMTYQSPLPHSILDLLEETVQNPKPLIRNSGTPKGTPRGQWIKRSNSYHSQNLGSSVQNQDQIFEIIETFSLYSIRSKFSDAEFKEIIKMTRNYNKTIIGVYEAYKVDGDEQELQETLKKILSTSESNLEVSFDREDSSNFIPLKGQQQKENMFTHAIISSNANSVYNQFPAPAAIANSKAQQKLQSIQQPNARFSIESKMATTSATSLATPFFLRQYLRENGIREQFTYEEKAFLVLGAKEKDRSLIEYVENLSNDGVLRKKIGTEKLQNIAKKLARSHYQQAFPLSTIQQIEKNKNDKFSYVCGALCNLFIQADFQKFSSIINQNSEEAEISPIQKLNYNEQDDFINIQQEFILSENNSILPQQQGSRIQFKKINTQQSSSSQIPFPSVQGQGSLFLKKYGTFEQQQQANQQQSQPQYQREESIPYSLQGSPSMQPRMPDGDAGSYISQQTQNQINLFGSNNSPQQDMDNLLARQTHLSSFDQQQQQLQQHQQQFQQYYSQNSNFLVPSGDSQRRKSSMLSTSKFEDANGQPVYSHIARERRRARKPTFQLVKKEESNEDPASKQKEEKKKYMQFKLIDQQLNILIDKFNQQMDQNNFNEKYQKSYQLLETKLRDKEEDYQIVSEMYQTRFPPLIEFLDNINLCEAYIGENMDKLNNMLRKFSHFVNREEYEIPTQFEISPRVKERINKYKMFKKLLKYLYEIDQFISQQQFNFFHYMYIKENIETLAAFEVFLLTGDINDFVENLVQIMKYHFFKKEFRFDEIEQFDHEVEQQLGVLFTFKKDLNYAQRNALEKTIKCRDTTLMALYNEYKIKNDRDLFIKNLRLFSDQRIQEFQEIEQNAINQSIEEEDDEIENNKFTLEKFFHNKLIKNVGRIQILTDLVDKRDERIKGIFEVYEFNKNKGELVENVTLLYQITFKKLLVQTLESLRLHEKFPAHQMMKLYQHIEQHHSVIFGAYEFYLDNNDLEEFKDSIQRILETL